jgi:hypothetical protein
VSESAPPTGDPGEARHVHDWSGMAFELDGEHPIAVQACPCGATRSIRAWEAYWEPGGPPAPHPARQVSLRTRTPPDGTRRG